MGNEKDFTRLYLNLDLINKRAADIRKALQLLEMSVLALLEKHYHLLKYYNTK